MLLFRRPYTFSLIFAVMTMCRLYESMPVKCAAREMCCSSVPQPKVPWLADMKRQAGDKSLIITAPRFLPENSFLAVKNTTVSKHIYNVIAEYSFIHGHYIYDEQTEREFVVLFPSRQTFHGWTTYMIRGKDIVNNKKTSFHPDSKNVHLLVKYQFLSTLK